MVIFGICIIPEERFMMLVLGFLTSISVAMGIFCVYNAIIFSGKARDRFNNKKEEITKAKVSST